MLRIKEQETRLTLQEHDDDDDADADDDRYESCRSPHINCDLVLLSQGAQH